MLPEHRGTNTVVIRIVKIVSDVQHLIPDYNGDMPCPTEGALVMGKSLASRIVPVSINTTKARYSDLHGLFRNEEVMSGLPKIL
jgi:hypothetical protein